MRLIINLSGCLFENREGKMFLRSYLKGFISFDFPFYG